MNSRPIAGPRDRPRMMNTLKKHNPPLLRRGNTRRRRRRRKNQNINVSSLRHSLSDRRHLDETFRAGRKERRVRCASAECTVSTDRRQVKPSTPGERTTYLSSDLVAVLMHSFYVWHTSPTGFTGNTTQVRRVDDVSNEFRSSSRIIPIEIVEEQVSRRKKREVGRGGGIIMKEEVKEEDKRKAKTGKW